MVASVVANVSGLMTGGLYLFLKSNTLSTIGPRDKVGEYERRKLKYKIRRADDSDIDTHSYRMKNVGLRRMDSDASLISNEKDEEFKDLQGGRRTSSIYDDQIPNPLRSHSVYPMNGMPRAPEPAKFSSMSSAFNHMRKRSYSLFPGSAAGTKTSFTLLPATTYSPNSKEAAADALKPPPSMRALTSRRHRRDSSLVSSATVQIGLRFSSVDDMPPVAQTSVAKNDTKVYHLDCPKLRDKEKDSPLSGRPAALNTPISSPTDDGTLVDDSLLRDPVKDAKMKTLPPVPNPKGAPVVIEDESDCSDDDEEDEEDEEDHIQVTLSPNVYNPQSPTKAKLPSPRGVGFTMLTNSATAAAKPASGSASPQKPAAATTKSDWI